MSEPKHILVFRFSSLGDIAMTVPVIKNLLQQYPGLHITFVSVAFVKPMFDNIERLQFITADTKAKHEGVDGLFRLYKQLNKTVSFDAIADLHNVLRTQILRVFFTGKRMAAIDKGRDEKRQVTRQKNKVLKPLPSTFQRYANVFAKLGLPVELNIQQGITKTTNKDEQWKEWKQSGFKIIGIAPFARYEEKMYPLEKMQRVIELLLQQLPVKIILFGGNEDAPALQQIAATNTNHIYSLAGTIDFAEELQLISQLDIMISMDSANMHLASLYGVPVVSIWGGTHPYLGFLGWGQSLQNCIQIDLECRPSSVFGNKPCPNHLACMNGISPLIVAEKVVRLLR